MELGQDETAEPGPSDRDLTEDGTGRLGLAFNNPYLQRVYVDVDWFMCRRSLCYYSEYVWGTVTCIGSTPPCFMD